MSNQTVCSYDVGKPSGWLAAAGLQSDRKACAVPLAPGCGANSAAITTCCTNATKSQNSSAIPLTTITNATASFYGLDTIEICALPVDASNATFTQYMNCLLNYPGRKGGYRCNQYPNNIVGQVGSDSCNNINGIITAPIAPNTSQEVCSLRALDNPAAIMQRCCGSPAVSYAEGCYMYCVAPLDPSVISCISQGFRAQNASFSGPVCSLPNPNSTNSTNATGFNNTTTPRNDAGSWESVGMGGTAALVVLLAWIMNII